MKFVGFRLPEKLIEELDKLVESGRYASRGEVVREALRQFLEEKRKESEKK